MAVWETDDEGFAHGNTQASTAGLEQSLAANMSRSDISRPRSVTPPGKRSSAASSLGERADKNHKGSSRDITTDSSISILDPRRFTPTLHANLVSEILTLRRDQEDKIRLIDSLEATLHATKADHDNLQQRFTSVSKESRSLQRQMSLLEGGTSSALGELAKERDEAVDTVSETKRRLEVAQKKIRVHEDDSQRIHNLWAKDKDTWENDKRKYERRLHVAENRLKGILEEVAAYQAAHVQGGAMNPVNQHDNEVEEGMKDNDATSIRTMSLTNSLRFSVTNSIGAQLPIGNTLADELGSDSDDDVFSDTDARQSVLSSPQRIQSIRGDAGNRVHQRTQSIEGPIQSPLSKLHVNQSVLEALEGNSLEKQPVAPSVTYTETGVQYSPPPSPVLAAVEAVTPLPAATRVNKSELSNLHRGDSEIEANQRRKRSQVNKPVLVEPFVSQDTVLSSAQTTELPASPPWTPKLQQEAGQPPIIIEIPTPMVSSATQTEASPKVLNGLLEPISASRSQPLSIPSINIQPPTSRPTTPHSPKLPPYTKHFGCQVNLPLNISVTNASAQTEGIQVDKRLALLPSHLQPSNITSRPNSPLGPNEKHSDATISGPIPPKNPLRETRRRRLTDELSSPVSAEDTFQYNKHDSPSARFEPSALQRTRRVSSLFAGFESASSDGADEFADLSDGEYQTALTAPRPPSGLGKAVKRNSFGAVVSSPDRPVPGLKNRISNKPLGIDLYASTSAAQKRAEDSTAKIIETEDAQSKRNRTVSKESEKSIATLPVSTTSYAPGGGARKATGTSVSQHTRSRSPSLPDAKNPPFPIPARDSSKRLSSSVYSPSDGHSSPTRGYGWYRRGSNPSMFSGRNNVRRVQSATAMAKQRYRRHGSRSPPPLSVSTEAPESPKLPPLPRNDLTTPRAGDRNVNYYKRHRNEPSTNTANTLNTNETDIMSISQASGPQSTGVVDAIAQTMVGEWMFKYVRRRKSFSMPDNSSKDDTGNDRHKRWVWLAPYERAILWSSRQPSSGSALMGKSGRKLTIQSVLDVKDDNPSPKTGGPAFHRSILILTPQRALKFTAVSSERHYLWLTALSFLAHSAQAVPDIIAAPQQQLKPQQQRLVPNFEVPPIPTKARRPGIRDSIRLAKGKTGIANSNTPSIPTLKGSASGRVGDIASYRIPALDEAGSGGPVRGASEETAEPPAIARFSDRTSHLPAHNRKRSNTGGHVPPPLSFRGFSGPVGSPAITEGAYSTGNSVDTVGSEMQYSQASSNTTWGLSQPESYRSSEASSRPSNFFDAIGTVRMEAFISPLAFEQINDVPEPRREVRRNARRRSREIRRRSSRSRTRELYQVRGSRGHDDYYGGSRTAGEDEYEYRDDPFKGF